MRRRAKRDFDVLGFESTHDALAAEAALRRAGIDVVAIPSPRVLGSTCGIAMRLEQAEAEAALAALAAAGIEPVARAVIQDV